MFLIMAILLLSQIHLTGFRVANVCAGLWLKYSKVQLLRNDAKINRYLRRTALKEKEKSYSLCLRIQLQEVELSPTNREILALHS